MRIRCINVQNYKGYRDSGLVEFETGFNVVVGQNNAGKTALLEAASIEIPGRPHRSMATMPSANSVVNPSTVVRATFEISGAELREMMLRLHFQFTVPIDGASADVPLNLERALMHLDRIFSYDRIDLTFVKTTQENSSSVSISSSPSQVLYKELYQHVHFGVFRTTPDKAGFEFSQTGRPDNFQEWWTVISYLMGQIYSFRAERLTLGSAAFGSNEILAPDARNLAEALNQLNRNPARFNRFNEFVSRIFPSIQRITVAASKRHANLLEVMVWSVDPKSERDDLAVPLSESGTGIGQVLAILYVVVSSNFSRTIIIDEPNSFLHPGAAKKLIEILRRDFPLHQYIISTHSPEIIRSADPATLTLVRWQDSGSVAEQLDSSSIHSLQSTLEELGVKLSDVFGSDKILWVEGPTEEKCFPLILSNLLSSGKVNASVIGVVNTGDFEAKKMALDRIMSIYDRFSSGNALVPPTAAFVFDREKRNEREIEDLTRRGQGKIHFIPRRMFENYLLDEDAIHAVLEQDGSLTSTALDVRGWIETNGAAGRYVASTSAEVQVFGVEWFVQVDGAKLLKDLFDHFVGPEVTFAKTTHSIRICEWLVRRKPEQLRELANFLASLLDHS